MNRVFGKISEFALIRQDASCTAVAYDYKPEPDGENATWCEVIINRLHPNYSEVKGAIINDINADTDAKILSGFVWQGINVWLSEENQRNFSEAQRMAEKYGDAVLPLRFKLGEDSEGNPVYHTFETVTELDAFYTQAFRYVNQCLNEGWQRKDSIDWEPYKELFPEPEEPVTE